MGLPVEGQAVIGHGEGNWPALHFSALEDDADDVTVDRHARAYNFWGSATLAYLYRNLCRASRKGAKDMGGCLMLLQIWSWEHIHIGRPIIRTVRPDGQHDQEDDADDFEPILGSQHRRGMDPLAVSWLRVYLSRSHSPHTLVYYRDTLDRQRDEQDK
ncbi:serine/threonine-protein phosphatase 7 long form homolog [Amaranthus tricolor]|uniref:serine/threonine-protein phosphatase 7 long form homolog n=1 Tax=Amaranthus tricolor TaxID=29722 RepID=UPI0025841C5A|nr:serine/threonine-protein phosphatase 7 long form homolog [Amaranthus tricolor]